MNTQKFPQEEIKHPEKILRLKAVKNQTGLPSSTIYLKISKNEFPAPISLGARSVGWLESEIDTWIDQRIQQSRQGKENQE